MPRLKLTIDSPEREDVRELLVERFPFQLGRALQNDLPILCRSVSGRHLLIDCDADTLLVTDVGSTNGTRYNGAVLTPGEPYPVALPARLEVGDVRLEMDTANPAETLFTMAESATRLREMVNDVVAQSNVEDETRPFFEILSGPGGGKRYFLKPHGKETIIGTGADADILLKLPNLPRKLGSVRWEDTRCVLFPEDDCLRYEGAAFERRRLESGDRIVVGAVELLYYDPLQDALDALDNDDGRPARSPESSDEPLTGDVSDSSPFDAPAVEPRTDAEQKRDTAEMTRNDDGPTDWGAIEVILLAMSAFFLVGTLALFYVLFAT